MDRTRRITKMFYGKSRIYLSIVCFLAVSMYLGVFNQHIQFTRNTSMVSSLSSAVNIVDLNQTLENDTRCIQTKKLLNLYSTTICLHNTSDYLSGFIAREHIWEEDYVSRLLNILIRNPHLSMIDIGANIGGYTMFTAGALARFTLAVDCYMPSIQRIIRAIQIQKAQNHVVLVQNALYSTSGEYLTLSKDGPSGIHIGNKTQKDSTSQYIVKTIRFDDLLPILMEKGVRAAMIKIDVEGAEIYLCETGPKTFEVIDIQIVMMEWGFGLRKTFEKQFQSMVECFTQHNYITTDEKCTLLNVTDWRTTWPGNIYWIKKNNFKKNIC